MFTSQNKLKICELATGNKNQEEWSFLPNGWKCPLEAARTIFDKNFLFVEFEHPWGNFFMHPDLSENGDLLILNLASRKPFWMKKHFLEDEIKAKARDPQTSFV